MKLPAILMMASTLGLGAILAAEEPTEPTPAPAKARTEAPLDETGKALFERVDPSVVAIQHEQAGGSGFIVSPNGYILTNGHVVEGQDDEDPRAVAKRITVILHDDKKYRATVIGHSLDPDVALIKIQPDAPLTPVELGDSDTAHTGQPCYAFGMPVGLKRTLTAGILSSVERTDMGTYVPVLQTDAAINHGNSGGPLFNQQGQVLGLNTYAGGGQNLGFTIPINVAKVLKEHFLKYGHFRRAVIPTFVLQELYNELGQALGVEKGVLVDYVVPGSDAEKAGFATGDVITEMNGQPVAARNSTELLRFRWKLVTQEVGATATFKLLRRQPGGGWQPREVSFQMKEDDPPPTAGVQVGEIPQTLYGELGLGVERVVPMSRLLYNLPENPGVLVTTVVPNTPAQKAGLSALDLNNTPSGDLITAVEGELTPDPDAFQSKLSKQLSGHRKAIRITIQRKKKTVQTALAPCYTLAGKRVALLAPEKDAEWVELIQRTLLVSGAEVTLAAGKQIAGLKAADLDGVILAGGSGALALRDDEAVLALIREAVKAKKVVAGVGAGSIALIKAEPTLRALRMTTAEEEAEEAVKLQAKQYTGKAVENDGKMVTTTGLDKPAVRAFLQALKSALIATE